MNWYKNDRILDNFLYKPFKLKKKYIKKIVYFYLCLIFIQKINEKSKSFFNYFNSFFYNIYISILISKTIIKSKQNGHPIRFN